MDMLPAILMVDDNPTNLYLLKAILDHTGIELVRASSGAEALRHVLVGGVHSVEDFAAEVADHEGGDVLPPHEVTKIIGEVLAEIDS